MRELPSQYLDKRVKRVWRISAIIVVSLCTLLPALFCLPIGYASDISFFNGAGIVFIIAWIVLLAIFAGGMPQLRYKRWRYEIGEHELEIMRGIFWRQRFLIPYIRVQNTDTKQGPLMRMCGLSSVTVSTAAGEHEIPGLDIEIADSLRDAISTQVRLAKEDV